MSVHFGRCKSKTWHWSSSFLGALSLATPASRLRLRVVNRSGVLARLDGFVRAPVPNMYQRRSTRARLLQFYAFLDCTPSTFGPAFRIRTQFARARDAERLATVTYDRLRLRDICPLVTIARSERVTCPGIENASVIIHSIR